MDTNINILVVEDSEFQSEIFAFYLKGMGFNKITQAGNGAEAFALLEKDSYDLIISDWEMPEMDGLELLGRIRQNDILENIPFIILTVFDDKEKIIAAVKAGITDYIVKPVERNVLEKKIKNIFGWFKLLSKNKVFPAKF